MILYIYLICHINNSFVSFRLSFISSLSLYSYYDLLDLCNVLFFASVSIVKLPKKLLIFENFRKGNKLNTSMGTPILMA